MFTKRPTAVHFLWNLFAPSAPWPCAHLPFLHPLLHPFHTRAHAHTHSHKHLPLVGLQQLCHLPESIGGNHAAGLVTVYMRSQRLASQQPSCRQGNNTDLMYTVLAVKCEKQSQWIALETPPPTPCGPGQTAPTDPHKIVAALKFSRHISKSASCVKVP